MLQNKCKRDIIITGSNSVIDTVRKVKKYFWRKQGKESILAGGRDFRQRSDNMAGISRKFLAALQIEDDKVDEIMSAYSNAINEVKEERDALKADKAALKEARAKLEALQGEYDTLKESMENGKSPYKVKYEALKEEFESYKTEQEHAKSHADKADAYRKILQEIGVSEKRIDSIIKVTDVDSLEFDSNGVVKDADSLKKTAKDEWADFIVKEDTKGAETATPPANDGGGTMTKEDIFKIKDSSERQKAIAENHELFGF